MNITPYCVKTPMPGVLLRIASLGKDYSILYGNEYFYELINNEKGVPFLSFLHPDDREEFESAVRLLEIEEQHLVIRFKAYNSAYRYYKTKIYKNGHMVDGFESYDVTLMDIYTVENRAVELELNAKKYRRYMAMMDQFYFEYEPDKNIFKIFTYMSDRNNMLIKQDLDEFCKQMKATYIPDKKSEMALEVFAGYLKDCVEEFEIQIAARLLSKAGRVDNLVFKGSTFYYNDNKIVMGIMISKGRLQIERAYYLTEAAKDCATGLFNKRATMEYAVDRIKRSSGKKVAIIIIDIDNFKNINDSFGHLFGDEVILKISDIIKGAMHARGVAGRFGGDEFMVILEDGVTDERIGMILNSIADQMRWTYKGIRDDVHLTASIGVAKYPENGNTYEELFSKADKALYVAKKNGKDGYVIYDESIHGSIVIQENNNRRHKLGSDWSQSVSSCILDLHCNGVAAIPGVLKTIKELTEVDAVTIFAGKAMKKVFQEGTYKYPIEIMEKYLDGNPYLNRFAETGFVIVNNIEKFDVGSSNVMVELEKQDIKAFAQCVSYKDNEPFVFVSYDVFEHGYQWSKEEIDSLMILGKMMGQVIIERNEINNEKNN